MAGRRVRRWLGAKPGLKRLRRERQCSPWTCQLRSKYLVRPENGEARGTFIETSECCPTSGSI